MKSITSCEKTFMQLILPLIRFDIVIDLPRWLWEESDLVEIDEYLREQKLSMIKPFNGCRDMSVKIHGQILEVFLRPYADIEKNRMIVIKDEALCPKFEPINPISIEYKYPTYNRWYGL